MEFKNKVAWLTGGISGIGAAAARAFYEEGANLLLTDINVELGEEFIKGFDPDRAIFIKADQRIRPELESAAAKAVEKWGRLDILFNSAGKGYMAPLLSDDPNVIAYSTHEWEDHISCLLSGSYHCAQIAANYMVKNEPDAGGERGNIILIASMAADKVWHWFDDRVDSIFHSAYGWGYGAGKAGILGLSRDLAVILAPHGIRVNTIKPGYILTPLTGRKEDGIHGEADMIYPPMQLFPKLGGQPENIATTAVEIVKNPFINRAELAIDGGIVG